MVKIDMQRRRKHIITFLFLVYFFLYVVSPLCYAEDRLDEGSQISHAAKCNIKNIRIIWELVLSRLTQNENADDSNSGVKFFIKKARAVLSLNNIVKLLQESAVPPIDNCFLRTESVAFFAELADVSYQQGFYLSFSGLSPPQVKSQGFK
ncbi:hypothetical protein JZK55_03530 [Dissulfurispira thermophila]|uniref:Uncharacterized protein n=1 Tax=Dissulfurispira thermophila TaxID=2715679 RepID=A0A7G1GZW6_9BACT|nr:hypothetical protein [Dissulfurispira thermophila]BCB95431.1 hypothetical protein JZK55_03530 [Dissulfurispira thermophila]